MHMNAPRSKRDELYVTGRGEKLIPLTVFSGYFKSHAHVTGCWRTGRQCGVGWAGLLEEVTNLSAVR